MVRFVITPSDVISALVFGFWLVVVLLAWLIGRSKPAARSLPTHRCLSDRARWALSALAGVGLVALELLGVAS